MRANEHHLQRQGTMTNRVKHKVPYIYIYFYVLRSFLFEGVGPRVVHAFRTTTGCSWADPASIILMTLYELKEM